jgi:hypothetical protein
VCTKRLRGKRESNFSNRGGFDKKNKTYTLFKIAEPISICYFHFVPFGRDFGTITELFVVLLYPTGVIIMRNRVSTRMVSILLDQDNFYSVFERDLKKARKLVVIESPFITKRRINSLLPTLKQLVKRGVRIVINTKPFEEHDSIFYDQALCVVDQLQAIGVEVFMTVGHHRKLAIIDDCKLYEGSLNILSQNDSCEIMRRIKSTESANEMLHFIGFKKWDK